LTLSVQEIVCRHAILRTSFKTENGSPIQVVAPCRAIEMRFLDLSGGPNANPEQDAYWQAASTVKTPFNLAEGPLLRVELIRTGSHESILLRAMHHIVCDASSLGIFTRELTTLYEYFNSREPVHLAAPPIQYGDYAAR
jgi:hypothetical protein